MPPQISEDESSAGNVSEEEYEVKKEIVKDKGKRKVKQESEPAEELQVESDEEEEEDEGEIAADEYVVEKIVNHALDEQSGVLIFQVKWEGYEKKSDMTWEPESNLETAQTILDEYLAKVGGKEFLMNKLQGKKAEIAENKQGKKRGRQSTGTSTPQTNGKKSRRNGNHPASQSPPVAAQEAQFTPPSGSWEDKVIDIEAMAGTNNEIIVYLTWEGGHKSQHALNQVYKRCPQKMLKFYERHLVFKKPDEETES
ncbi:hypothetical protein ACMFMG_005931 [Clarireedia jacksonii]